MKASGAAGDPRQRIGAALERALSAIEDHMASPERAVALGIGLAGAAVLGGIAAFVIVWALLAGVVG